MLKRFIAWFRIHKRFAELQKSNDARLMLNRRLSQQNADLKSELQKRKKPKGEALSSGAQKHITKMSDSISLIKAKNHVEIMRREVELKKMAALLPFDSVNAIQLEVRSMSDLEVLAWRKPK